MSVLVLALLYFALMSLILIESTASFRNAVRFRSRVRSQVLAENGAELAAQNLVAGLSREETAANADGSMWGKITRIDETNFRIDARGVSAGPQSTTAQVQLWGHVDGASVSIDRAVHSP